MGTGYQEGNDAYNSGGGGSGGGVQSITAGEGIATTGTPQNPVVSALVQAQFNLKRKVEANQIVLAGIGTALYLDDGSTNSPGPGWNVFYFDGSNPLTAIILTDIREALHLQYSLASGVPVSVYNLGTSSLQIIDSTATFNGSPGPYILPAKSSALLVTTDQDAWTLQQIGPALDVMAGAGISIDKTNPKAPIISTSGSPGGSVAGFITMPLATCRSAAIIPNINNGGSMLATLAVMTAPANITRLGIWTKQLGGGLITLGIYTRLGVLLAKTNSFVPNVLGYNEYLITTDGSGLPITSVSLPANTSYYLAVHGTQASNGVQFYGQDIGTTFGPSPWLGWVRDNIATMPNSIGSGSESAQRFMLVARE